MWCVPAAASMSTPPRWTLRLFPNTPVKLKLKLLFNSCPISSQILLSMPSHAATSCSTVRLSSLRFCFVLAGPRSKPLVDFLDALTRVIFRIVAILMRIRSHPGFWRNGVHHRQVRSGFVGTSRENDSDALHHVFPLRGCPVGAIARLAGFGILRFLLVSSRRNSSGIGD